MSKNIIICCDGTAGKFGTHNTNVVRLFSVCKKDDPRIQICYYDGGVGTIEESTVTSKFSKWWRRIKGLAFGLGFRENIIQAYTYLMNNYEPGDKVYLFGYSRGAFAVRVLAGMIKNCGLLDKGNTQLIPYAYELYSMEFEETATKFGLMGRFKKDFSSRDCQFHFIGLWDTVSSIGWVDHFQTFPNTTKLENVKTVRQALAIDEKRTFFTSETLSDKNHSIPDLEEVWFAGSHGDIGGGHIEEHSRLSKVPLIWMLGEATHNGLIIHKDRYEDTVLKEINGYVAPDPNFRTTNSLTHVWWVAEVLPKTIYKYDRQPLNNFVPMGRRRPIQKGWKVHHTVFQRPDYIAPNLPDAAHMVPVKSKPVQFLKT